MSADAAAPKKIIEDISAPDVATKYTTAAGIANKALETVIAACVAGADISDICELGDKTIEEECGKVYNKKVKGEEEAKKDKKDEGVKISKGIAFPTCVNVNEVAAHYTPFKGEGKCPVLKGGDVVKVDLGVHIDGYLTQAGHTVVVPVGDEDSKEGVNEAGKVCDRRADVLKAAWYAAEAAARMIKVGGTNNEVSPVFQKTAEMFGCNAVQGVLSHENKKNIIDGSNSILSREVPNDEQKVDEFKFAENTVYTMEVSMSTGEGKTRDMDTRPMVFKRQVENTYALKTPKARQFIGEVSRRFPFLPFSLRSVEDKQVAQLGVAECKRHQLLQEFPVLTERAGEFVASFKYSVLILPGGVKKVTGLAFQQSAAMPELDASKDLAADEEMVKLVNSSLGKKKRNKKNNKEEKKEE